MLLARIKLAMEEDEQSGVKILFLSYHEHTANQIIKFRVRG